MLVDYYKGLIWIPSIEAFYAKERFELIKLKSNSGLKMKSKTRNSVKRKNYNKSWNQMTHYHK